MAEKFQFKYLTAPTGELSGQSMVQQTEDAINAIGELANKSETDSSSAVAIANQAMQKADNAQSVANNLSVRMEALSASVQTIQETVDANTEQSLQAVSLAQASANSAQVSELSAKDALANSTSAKLSADLSAASAEQSLTAATEAQTQAAASATAAQQAQAKAEEAQSNAENAQNAANNAAESATGSASSAQVSALASSDSAELSQKWAVSTESPDGEADTESTTNLTQSSRTWALESKAQATASKASADAASASATAAQSSADTATSSATTATTSATTATTKASEAAASATEAKTAADEAKQALVDADVSTVIRYTEQSLTDAQKTQARTNIGVDMSGYLPLSGGTMTGSATFGTSSGAIRRTVEDDVIELWGGSTTYCGKLGLFGQNSTTHPGEFRLYTYNSTNSNVRCLAGSRDGYLSWNGCFTTNTTNVVSFDRTKGSVPSESEYRALYFSSDQSLTYNKVLGAVETGVYADGGAGCYLFCLHNSTADLARAEIGCRVLANGTTQCYSNSVFMATSLQATSDIRKKTDIKEVAPDLSSIKTYEYVLKDDGKRHVGLIAQEVEKVLPTAVSEDDEGFKSLDYNSVVAALVGEINALKKRVAELENEQ